MSINFHDNYVQSFFTPSVVTFLDSDKQTSDFEIYHLTKVTENTA